MKKLSTITALLALIGILLSACSPIAVGAAGAPTAQPAPTIAPTVPAGDVIFGSGKILDQSIDIVLEQGSGEACSPGATYLVRVHVTTDGPISARYEIESTAGQIAAGSFVDPDTGALKPAVDGTINIDASLFAADGTQAVTLPFRFVGPYPYPDNIQVNFRVDGGSWVSAKVACP
jgi:hypothetical protein